MSGEPATSAHKQAPGVPAMFDFDTNRYRSGFGQVVRKALDASRMSQSRPAPAEDAERAPLFTNAYTRVPRTGRLGGTVNNVKSTAAKSNPYVSDRTHSGASTNSRLLTSVPINEPG
jgi:hypothetical protein